MGGRGGGGKEWGGREDDVSVNQRLYLLNMKKDFLRISEDNLKNGWWWCVKVRVKYILQKVKSSENRKERKTNPVSNQHNSYRKITRKLKKLSKQ